MVISFLNGLEVIFLQTSIAIVSAQLNGCNYCHLTLLILFNINHLFTDIEVVTSIAIQHYSFICTQLNGFKYCFVKPIIHFRPTVKEFQVLLFNTNNSVQHCSFVCSQLNGSKYCYVSLTIQLNISHFFIYSQIIKQFYF